MKHTLLSKVNWDTGQAIKEHVGASCSKMPTMSIDCWHWGLNLTSRQTVNTTCGNHAIVTVCGRTIVSVSLAVVHLVIMSWLRPKLLFTHWEKPLESSAWSRTWSGPGLRGSSLRDPATHTHTHAHMHRQKNTCIVPWLLTHRHTQTHTQTHRHLQLHLGHLADAFIQNDFQ